MNFGGRLAKGPVTVKRFFKRHYRSDKKIAVGAFTGFQGLRVRIPHF